MNVTYFALVSFDDYSVGDIIPGAAQWPYIQFYVTDGKVAPVLVSTLPSDAQEAVRAYEKEAQDALDAIQAGKDKAAAKKAAPRKRAAPKPEPEPTPEPTPFVPVDRAGNPLESDAAAE